MFTRIAYEMLIRGAFSRFRVGGILAAVCLAWSLPVRADEPAEAAAGGKPAVHRSFDPGWIVSSATRGPLRRLIAKPKTWTPKAMQDLQGLSSLEFLDLSGTTAGDDEMAALAPLASLKTLLLPGTRITDAAAVHIARLKKLETLDLSNTVISGAGLDELHGLRKLKWLVTDHSRVTEKGLESFESALPGFEAVRLWDVSFEEFDHGELVRTPRCNLIFDFPALHTGWKATGQFQLSGPLWKPAQKRSVARLPTLGPKRPGADSVWRPVISPERKVRRAAADMMKRPGADPVASFLCVLGSSVEVGNVVLKTSRPWRTYLVDGRGKARLAGFNLLWDCSRGMWIETPTKPDAVAQLGAGSRSIQDPAEKSYDASRNDSSERPHVYASSGEWNGKFVWETGYCRPGHSLLLNDTPLFAFDRSAPGLTIVFLHVPCHDDSHLCRGTMLSTDPRSSEAYFCYCLGLESGMFGHYEPKGFTAERDRFGSGYRAAIININACGRYDYSAVILTGATIPKLQNPNLRKPSHGLPLGWPWPDVWIEKRGTELVIPVTRDRETKRVEYCDRLGRKDVIEEQRIDLNDPRKTIVLDVYGRARVLRPVDADRVLRTRLRDYLDDGDPSPAGPVTPVGP